MGGYTGLSPQSGGGAVGGMGGVVPGHEVVCWTEELIDKRGRRSELYWPTSYYKFGLYGRIVRNKNKGHITFDTLVPLFVWPIWPVPAELYQPVRAGGIIVLGRLRRTVLDLPGTAVGDSPRSTAGGYYKRALARLL